MSLYLLWVLFFWRILTNAHPCIMSKLDPYSEIENRHNKNSDNVAKR